LGRKSVIVFPKNIPRHPPYSDSHLCVVSLVSLVNFRYRDSPAWRRLGYK
jgi:hypothetical protein